MSEEQYKRLYKRVLVECKYSIRSRAMNAQTETGKFTLSAVKQGPKSWGGGKTILSETAKWGGLTIPRRDPTFAELIQWARTIIQKVSMEKEKHSSTSRCCSEPSSTNATTSTVQLRKRKKLPTSSTNQQSTAAAATRLQKRIKVQNGRQGGRPLKIYPRMSDRLKRHLVCKRKETIRRCVMGCAEINGVREDVADMTNFSNIPKEWNCSQAWIKAILAIKTKKEQCGGKMC